MVAGVGGEMDVRGDEKSPSCEVKQVVELTVQRAVSRYPRVDREEVLNFVLQNADCGTLRCYVDRYNASRQRWNYDTAEVIKAVINALFMLDLIK